MNNQLFSEKLEQLKTAGGFDAGLVQAIGDWLGAASDQHLWRMNPLDIAAKLGTDEQATLDFFVHGARLGLFDLGWSMVCPGCGEVQNNDASLDAVSGDFFCVVCQMPVKVDADDSVEVSFGINPAIRTLKLDPFADAEAYRHYFFSSSVQRSTQMLEYMGTIWEGFEALPKGETLELRRTWEAGRSYRMVSAGVHSQFLFDVSPDAQPVEKVYEIDFNDAGLSPAKLGVDTTMPVFRIRNWRDEDLGLMIVKADFPTLHGIMRQHPSQLLPRLNANKLMNNQRFRQLFKIQNLSPSLKLNIRSLTLLFTDLKGSTALYDRTGDVDAFALIQEHFEMLGTIVARHGGAVIKTMGDAVMASFARPMDAVVAATEMLTQIGSLKTKDGSLGLKIGLHEGPALAISNQGALDYFGQTVNIAARVQGLAGPGTLWVSDPVIRSAGVVQHLRTQGYKARRYKAALKGVGEKALVYELRPAG